MTEIGQRNLLNLLALAWCREGGEPQPGIENT